MQDVGAAGGKESYESREYHDTVCLFISSKASEVNLPQVASTGSDRHHVH